MKSFYKLTNDIRDYSWGHHRYIPDFLGLASWPEGKPAAELWMGAHSSAPSHVKVHGVKLGLDGWIAQDPQAILGPQVTKRYGRLPFLFKLLAAGQSLSIQAHPDKQTAEEGFQREEDAGIPQDARHRNYRDDNHKPEVIMALTDFTAMIGFRELKDIRSNFANLMDDAGFQTSKLSTFLKSLLYLQPPEKDNLISQAVLASKREEGPWDEVQRRWIPRLAENFPGDIGALAPLFLNMVTIHPGEALYQPARTLHAYLEGFGMELMANSDNVLRGGLTGKNVDVPELMKVLDFHPTAPAVMSHPGIASGGMDFFDTPAEEFALGLGAVDASLSLSFPAGSGPLIVLGLENDILLDDGDESLRLQRGESAFVPWKARPITLGGRGKFAVARLGL